MDVERRIGGQIRSGLETVGLDRVDDEAGDGNDEAVHDDIPAAAVYGIDAVYRAADGSEVGEFRLPAGESFFLLEGRNGEHGEKVGDQIDHDSQIDEDVELLQQGRADGGKGQDGLDGDQCDDGHIGRTETVHLRQNGREVAEARCIPHHFGNGELPCREGYEAGADEHAGNDERRGIAEHGRIGQTEGRFGTDELIIGNKAADDGRGYGVDESREKGASQHRDGYVFRGIFHGFCIGAGRFQSEEGPEDHRDGVAHGDGEGHIIGIPGGAVDGRIEEIPAGKKQSRYRSEHADDSQRGEAARFLRSSEADGGGKHEDADGGSADLNGGKAEAEEIGCIADHAGRDGDVGDDEGNRVGEVRQEVACPAEAVFRIAAHASALFAVHSAHRKSVGQKRGAYGGQDPCENGYRADFCELGRQKDDSRSHHVDGCDCCELYHSHFFTLGQGVSLLSRSIREWLHVGKFVPDRLAPEWPRCFSGQAGTPFAFVGGRGCYHLPGWPA